MDFTLSKEEQLIQKAARQYAEKKIDPIAQEIEKNNEIPPEILSDLAELGMFGLPFPEEYGGGNAGYISYILALEQLSKSCSGIGMILSVNCVGLAVLNAFGTAAQKQKYMPRGIKEEEIFSFAFTEPGTGSDPKQLTTTAIRDDDYYLLNGTKRFISNAGFNGPMIVVARGEDGKASAFILEKHCKGYSVSEPWNKIGAQGGPLYDVYLQNVKVPVENRLGSEGDGLWILKIAMVYGKIGLTGLFLGGCLAAYEEGLAYARTKTHRGEPIGSKFQHIQLAIADMAMKYETAKWYSYHLGFAANTYKDPLQLVKEAALTKVYVAETAIDLARISMGIHGSYGLMRDYKIARIWDDAIIAPQVEGTAPLLKTLAAGIILKK